MEEKETTKTVVVEKPAKSPRFNIWKLLTLIIVAIVLFTGAYYLGTRKDQSIVVAPSPTPSSSIAPAPTSSSQAAPSVSPTPTPAPSKTVQAGGNIGVFFPYTISVPNDWSSNHTSTKDVSDELTITKGAYKISIRQFGGEGHMCLYGNEPDQPFSQKYQTYVEFQSADSDFRRSGDNGGTAWTICNKSNNGWGAPTIYGYISYTNPANADEATLKLMDSIIGSIHKQ